MISDFTPASQTEPFAFKSQPAYVQISMLGVWTNVFLSATLCAMYEEYDR